MRVERHDSPLGQWEMATRAAAPTLGPHVVDYVGYRERTPGRFRRVELPTGLVHVIVSFGPRVHAPDPLRSFVAPPDVEHSIVVSDREQHGIGIKMTPLGARRIFGTPMDEVTAARVVDLEAIMGRDGAELPERLYDLRDWSARFALLDRVLGERLERARSAPPGVEHAWWRLVTTHGAVPVATLAAEVGWSRRHLVARFRDHVGLPPKAFARILRFERAAELLVTPGGPSLSEIALEAGYYDQAHLNRDFRAFAGQTPTELLARRLPAGGGWLG
jgi:AraC-like DNA-binding protein